MESFIIHGGKKLSGEITVNASKNAAVALLAASVMNRGTTTLRNVPQIEEVFRWVEILESIGMQVEKQGTTFIITPPRTLSLSEIDQVAACKTRSIILLLGALAGRMSSYRIPQAGGCRLGSRTIAPHLFALEELGLDIRQKADHLAVQVPRLHKAETIVLYESGDTVVENALLAAAQARGITEIHFASANYMVQDLCFFLEACGVRIDGIGTSILRIHGKGQINKDVTYTISEDPIEAMFFLSLAAVTKSMLTIKRCPITFLELELLKMEKMGFGYRILRRYRAANGQTKLVDIQTQPSRFMALEDKIHPLPFPGLNIDNIPFFAAIASIAKGKTLIHDWIYENRAVYFSELNKLGAQVHLIDEHRAEITGPVRFQPATMHCPPALRPGAVVLVAMLAAKGRSVLKDVYMINRGYENLAERLQSIGADIVLVSE